MFLCDADVGVRVGDLCVRCGSVAVEPDGAVDDEDAHAAVFDVQGLRDPEA